MEHPCPLPEVAEALQPYIRSRQEVNHIRQAVRSKLPLSAVSAVAGASLPDKEPSSLPNVHKAYWKALQAHRQANARYRALKLEVEQLASDPHSTEQHGDGNASLLRDSYIPLIRQREKQRRLTALDRAFTKVQTVGGDVVTESFDSVVRKEIGDLPNPPSTSTFPERDLDAYEGPDSTALKQAILSVKGKIDSHRKIALETQPASPAEVSPQVELQALQDAHNELTIWMETQLGLISDVDPAAEANEAPPPTPAEPFVPKPGEDIASLYEHYLEGRETLLETIMHPTSHALPISEILPPPKREVDKESEQKLPAEAILPYVSALVALKQQDQDCLQQSAFTRRLLAAAEQEIQAVLARLADESHLVPPSLSRRNTSGKDWLDAANETAASTKTFALERLKSGQASVESALQVLAGIQGLPKSLDALMG